MANVNQRKPTKMFIAIKAKEKVFYMYLYHIRRYSRNRLGSLDKDIWTWVHASKPS